MLIGVGVVATFLLTRVIAQRLAMEFLPDSGGRRAGGPAGRENLECV
jgi:hypothetical protein